MKELTEADEKEGDFKPGYDGSVVGSSELSTSERSGKAGVMDSTFQKKNGQKEQKISKFILGKYTITFSSEGVLTQMRVLINSTQLDLQNKTDFRFKKNLEKVTID